ncbi:derepression protein [Escherichia coli]|nr:derepression protein [Escherichia coli]
MLLTDLLHGNTHIFSYLNEDIDFVLNELKAKGLCRDFLAQQKDRGDRTHV